MVRLQGDRTLDSPISVGEKLMWVILAYFFIDGGTNVGQRPHVFLEVFLMTFNQHIRY